MRSKVISLKWIGNLTICGLVVLLKLNTYAQVYVNNENSDSTAILEIISTNKGFLIPRLKDLAIDKLGVDGLLMYNTKYNYFNYYEDTSLHILNPWLTKAFSINPLTISYQNIKVGINTSDPQSTLEVNGSLKIKVYNVIPVSAENGTIIFKEGNLQIKIANDSWKVLHGINAGGAGIE